MFNLEKAKTENIAYLENLFEEIVIENPTILKTYLEAVNQNIKNLFMYEVDMDIKTITYDELAILIRKYYDDLIDDIKKCSDDTPIEHLLYLSNKIKVSVEHPDFIFSLYKHVLESNDIILSDDYLESQKKIIQTVYLIRQNND